MSGREPLIGIIFGPPGSGKGTQASLIGSEFDLDQLSTGEILRAEAARGSALGREAAELMRAGQLVPDRLMVSMIDARLRDAGARGVLLDGFPRTIEQAEALDEILARQGRQVNFVVALEAAEEELLDRLLHRAAIEHRADDTREAITERMQEYRDRTAPVLDYYRRRGVRVAEVDATGRVEDVFSRVRESLA